MRERIHEYSSRVRDGSGAELTARVFGRERGDGTWTGWIEFENPQTGKTLGTGQETSQPNRTDLEYWAAGLEPVYLEGALHRAREQRGAKPEDTRTEPPRG